MERYKILGSIAAGIVYTALAGFVGYTIGKGIMEEACQENLKLERAVSQGAQRDFRACVKNCGNQGLEEELKGLSKLLTDLLSKKQK